MFSDMGKELTEAEAAEAFAEMDKDGSGAIDFDEAFAWWENQDPEAQAALQESVKAMKYELDQLAVRGAAHTFARSLISLVQPRLLSSIAIRSHACSVCDRTSLTQSQRR